ncbi:MAG: ATP-dependent metallopeptidase FtsH/Yme1/Tma family protein, partial [Planctomycetota bacterium]
MAEEQPAPENKPSDQKKPPRPRQMAPAGWVLGLLLLLTMLMFFQQSGSTSEEISYSFFRQQVNAGNVSSVKIERTQISGEFREPPFVPATKSADESSSADKSPMAAPAETADQESPSDESQATDSAADSQEGPQFPEASSDEPEASNKSGEGSTADESADDSGDKEADRKQLPKNFFVSFQGDIDENWLDDNDVKVQFVNPVDYSGVLSLIWFAVLIALAVMMFSFFRRTRDQMMGGGMLGGVTKSPARRYESEEGPKITFDDVAGLKGVKEDLKEIVEFLKDPEKFQRLGARVPKGVLMNGPPGT